MSEPVIVDYSVADAWKRRAEATMKAEKLARQAVKTALGAVRANAIQLAAFEKKARLATNAASEAAQEAEKVWANTADTLRGQ